MSNTFITSEYKKLNTFLEPRQFRSKITSDKSYVINP